MSDRAEQAARWLEGRTAELEAALAPLVEINSFTDNPEGGRRVGAALRDLFSLPGLSAEVVPSARFADHLVLRSRPPEPGGVALIGHLDTVFPPGKFEGYRRDGALRRGPGVLDMKGGLVVVAFALRALAEAAGGLDRAVPLRVVIVSDEEVGSPEGQPIIHRAIQGCAAALVFESGRDRDAIITRRKGTGAITATAHGKAAHAGNAHAGGVNAIWALARFIDRAQQLTDYARGVTVNAGKVSGGQGKNTVPDQAEAQLDIRFCARADGEALVSGLHHAASEAAASVAGARIELSGGMSRMPLERSEASARLLEEYAACARASGLGAEEAPLVGGASDASTSSSMGIPSIDGLGPRGQGFHTVEERIEVDTLVPKAQALARFLAGRSLALLAVAVLLAGSACSSPAAPTPEARPPPPPGPPPVVTALAVFSEPGVDASATQATLGAARERLAREGGAPIDLSSEHRAVLKPKLFVDFTAPPPAFLPPELADPWKSGNDACAQHTGPTGPELSPYDRAAAAGVARLCQEALGRAIWDLLLERRKVARFFEVELRAPRPGGDLDVAVRLLEPGTRLRALVAKASAERAPASAAGAVGDLLAGSGGDSPAPRHPLPSVGVPELEAGPFHPPRPATVPEKCPGGLPSRLEVSPQAPITRALQDAYLAIPAKQRTGPPRRCHLVLYAGYDPDTLAYARLECAPAQLRQASPKSAGGQMVSALVDKAVAALCAQPK